VRLIVVNAAPNVAIDVDDVNLSIGTHGEPTSPNEASAGGNLLRNGDFARAPDYWFYSVNDFWPWHIENTWLLVLLETGWIGLLCFLGVLGFTFMRLLGRSGHAPPHRAVWLAALGGFSVVATFNSQFEFPRVTLMFFLILLLALMRAQAQPLVDALVQRARSNPSQRKRTAIDRLPED
jgi:O-antigen ligase